jgi:hypothetical protein
MAISSNLATALPPDWRRKRHSEPVNTMLGGSASGMASVNDGTLHHDEEQPGCASKEIRERMITAGESAERDAPRERDRSRRAQPPRPKPPAGVKRGIAWA